MILILSWLSAGTSVPGESEGDFHRTHSSLQTGRHLVLSCAWAGMLWPPARPLCPTQSALAKAPPLLLFLALLS